MAAGPERFALWLSLLGLAGGLWLASAPRGRRAAGVATLLLALPAAGLLGVLTLPEETLGRRLDDRVMGRLWAAGLRGDVPPGLLEEILQEEGGLASTATDRPRALRAYRRALCGRWAAAGFLGLAWAGAACWARREGLAFKVLPPLLLLTLPALKDFGWKVSWDLPPAALLAPLAAVLGWLALRRPRPSP